MGIGDFLRRAGAWVRDKILGNASRISQSPSFVEWLGDNARKGGWRRYMAQAVGTAVYAADKYNQMNHPSEWTQNIREGAGGIH